MRKWSARVTRTTQPVDPERNRDDKRQLNDKL